MTVGRGIFMAETGYRPISAGNLLVTSFWHFHATIKIAIGHCAVLSALDEKVVVLEIV